MTNNTAIHSFLMIVISVMTVALSFTTPTNGFIAPQQAKRQPFRATLLFSEPDSDTTSTTTPDDDDVDITTHDTPSITSLKTSLLLSTSRTDRGQNSSPSDTDAIRSLLSRIESLNPTDEPTLSPTVRGTWELIYADTQLFRSSPFFMAGRAVCGTEEEARRYDWFCDMHREALAISRIGKVRQVISSTRLVSEFEVKVGAIPFLSDFTPLAYSGGWPVAITGSIVSSADATPTSSGSAWELFMDTVQIKGSNVPLLRRILDGGLQLSSRSLGEFLETTVESYTNPKPVFEVTYLDEEMRVCRDQDGKVFVYIKVSDDEMETDYGDVGADLGIDGLWNGFRGAILNS